MDKKKSRIVLIVCLIAAAAAVGIGAFLLSGNGYSEERLDAFQCFDLESEEEAAIIRNSVLSETKALRQDGRIYIPYEIVSSLSGNPFYYEKSSGALYLTTQKENHIWTPEGDPDVLAVLPDQTVCVAAEIVSQYAEADIEVYDEPARVLLRTQWTDVATASAAEDTQIRQKGNKKSPIAADVWTGDILYLTGEDEDGWIAATTADGYTGYVETEKITINPPKNLEHTENTSTAFETIQMKTPIKMVWHYVDVQENNDILDYMLEDTSGINVICPTWITPENLNGDIYSLADTVYAANIRSRGMKLWTMVSDYTGADGTTGDILTDPDARKNLITKIMEVAVSCDLDGINIDFETITEDQADAYLQFLRELSIRTHEEGIILSTDNYVPVYTTYYDRTEQAKIVDYIVIMGYDEHTEYSEEPGSVASLSFVRDGILRTLKEVPKEQLILGVPFYTRTWTQPLGSTTFETTAVAMPRARDFAAEKNIQLIWNENDGQYEGTSEDEAARYSIWMEDAASLEKKLELVREYGLAGASAWRLGLEEADVWEVWNRQLKE